MSDHEHRGHCPVCNSRTIDRIGGEWCPRCLGWVFWYSEHGTSYWTLRRPMT